MIQHRITIVTFDMTREVTLDFAYVCCWFNVCFTTKKVAVWIVFFSGFWLLVDVLCVYVLWSSIGEMKDGSTLKHVEGVIATCKLAFLSLIIYRRQICFASMI